MYVIFFDCIDVSVDGCDCGIGCGNIWVLVFGWVGGVGCGNCCVCSLFCGKGVE